MANLTERSPKASALEATAVLIESTDTNAAEQTEIAVVMYFFNIVIIPLKFNSLRIPEHIPNAKKAFESGIKMLADM